VKTNTVNSKTNIDGRKTFQYVLDAHSPRFICFIIYSYGYLITSFLLKCLRQAHGNNLYAYYICENIHGLVGPQKTYTAWEMEVKNFCQCFN
jgi:hypothetical protein